jgi:hypothetical protein
MRNDDTRTPSLEERFLKTAEEYRRRAKRLPPGRNQQKLLDSADRFEAQAKEGGFIR